MVKKVLKLAAQTCKYEVLADMSHDTASRNPGHTYNQRKGAEFTASLLFLYSMLAGTACSIGGAQYHFTISINQKRVTESILNQ